MNTGKKPDAPCETNSCSAHVTVNQNGSETMTRLWWIVLAVACMCVQTPSNAQDAKAVIHGPNIVETGDLLVLDATGSQGDCFHWVLVNSHKTFLAVEDGRKLAFAAGTAQEYTFVLVVACCTEAGSLSVDMAEYRVRVGGGPAPPPPDLPDGRWGFTKTAYRLLKELVPTDKRHYAQPLGDNFEAIAASIDAGTYDEFAGAEAVEKAILALQSKNRQTLKYVDSEHPGDAQAWQAFFAEWKKKADELNALPDSEQALRTVAQYGEAFRETARGLKVSAPQ
jgi:hypothetical protein